MFLNSGSQQKHLLRIKDNVDEPEGIHILAAVSMLDKMPILNGESSTNSYRCVIQVPTYLAEKV